MVQRRWLFWQKPMALMVLVGSLIVIGCGGSGENTNIADDATEDAKAEYKRMIAEEEAKMAGTPPDGADR